MLKIPGVVFMKTNEGDDETCFHVSAGDYLQLYNSMQREPVKTVAETTGVVTINPKRGMWLMHDPDLDKETD